jgi:hypothetical protein
MLMSPTIPETRDIKAEITLPSPDLLSFACKYVGKQEIIRGGTVHQEPDLCQMQLVAATGAAKLKNATHVIYILSLRLSRTFCCARHRSLLPRCIIYHEQNGFDISDRRRHRRCCISGTSAMFAATMSEMAHFRSLVMTPSYALHYSIHLVYCTFILSQRC